MSATTIADGHECGCMLNFRDARLDYCALHGAAGDLLETLKAVAPLIDSIDRMLDGWNGPPSSKSPLGPMVHAAISKAEGL